MFMWSSEVKTGRLLQCVRLLTWRDRVSHQTWHSVRLSGQQAPEILLSASSVAGAPGTPPALVIHMSTGNLNSSPHVCMTGNVMAEPTPSSQVSSFYLQV